MEPIPITLPSGALLEFKMASTQTAVKLNRLLAKELKAAGLDFSKLGESKINLSGVLSSKEEIPPGAISLMIDVICQVIGSEELDRVVFECSTQTLYNGARVNYASFDAPESRQDYYPFCKEVILRNAGPFFAGALSMFSTLLAGAPKGQP